MRVDGKDIPVAPGIFLEFGGGTCQLFAHNLAEGAQITKGRIPWKP